MAHGRGGLLPRQMVGAVTAIRRGLMALLTTSLLALMTACAGTPIARPPVNGPGSGPVSATGAQVSIDTVVGFAPRTTSIKSGGGVTWSNPDKTEHNVGGSGIVSGVIEPGGSFTYKFEQPGTYQYICTLHPDTEEGQVIVEPR